MWQRQVRKNSQFTQKYGQPDDYHFCQDSLLLAEFVAEQTAPSFFAETSPIRVLDLGAGCGVIGLELAHLQPRLQHLDFIELQSLFIPFIEQNLKAFPRALQSQVHQMNFTDLKHPEWGAKYDLIVSNPPYFHTGQGLLSPSDERNRCRFFLDSSFSSFLLGIQNALKPFGTGFFLIKSEQSRGRDHFAEAKSWLQPGFELTQLADIRGTSVVCLESVGFYA